MRESWRLFCRRCVAIELGTIDRLLFYGCVKILALLGRIVLVDRTTNDLSQGQFWYDGSVARVDRIWLFRNV